ncbi:hypothetical protein Hanom_Chr07g00623871 [Helianthus anomalus]
MSILSFCSEAFWSFVIIITYPSVSLFSHIFIFFFSLLDLHKTQMWKTKILNDDDEQENTEIEKIFTRTSQHHLKY